MWRPYFNYNIGIGEKMITRDQAIAKIKEIQNGGFDRHATVPPKGRLSIHYWDDGLFSLGMEYGAIVMLMQLFDLTEADLEKR